jgi:membrane associated rhomboid family serine protease
VFVLPVNKDSEGEGTPWVVILLISANSVLLAASYIFFSSPDSLIPTYGFVPAHPHIKTLFSSMFLHAGIWHLIGNMWFLWMFGPKVENTFGPWLFSVFYVLCGFSGGLLHMLLNLSSTIPCVGASGAISGVAGAYFVLFPKSDCDLVIYIGWWELKTIATHTRGAVGAWIVEQSILGLLTEALKFSSVAFWAHVGGFVAGIAAAFTFKSWFPERLRLLPIDQRPWFLRGRVEKETSKEDLTVLKL